MSYLYVPSSVGVAKWIIYISAGLGALMGAFAVIAGLFGSPRLLLLGLVVLAMAGGMMFLASRLNERDKVARNILVGLSAVGLPLGVLDRPVGLVRSVLYAVVIFMLAVHPDSRKFFAGEDVSRDPWAARERAADAG